MDRGKGRAARRKKARARSEGLHQDGQDGDQDGDQDGLGVLGYDGDQDQDGDQDADTDTDSGQDSAGGQDDTGQRQEPQDSEPQDSKPQDLPQMDLGGGSGENMLSNLTGSPGAGLLGLDPPDLDGGGSDVEEEPRPQVLIDEGPRPHRTRTRTAAPDDDPEVHESARQLGQRSAEVRHRRRLAAPKIPTLAPPKPEPLRPPPGFDPPRLPGPAQETVMAATKRKPAKKRSTRPCPPGCDSCLLAWLHYKVVWEDDQEGGCERCPNDCLEDLYASVSHPQGLQNNAGAEESWAKHEAQG